MVRLNSSKIGGISKPIFIKLRSTIAHPVLFKVQFSGLAQFSCIFYSPGVVEGMHYRITDLRRQLESSIVIILSFLSLLRRALLQFLFFIIGQIIMKVCS